MVHLHFASEMQRIINLPGLEVEAQVHKTQDFSIQLWMPELERQNLAHRLPRELNSLHQPLSVFSSLRPAASAGGSELVTPSESL